MEDLGSTYVKDPNKYWSGEVVSCRWLSLNCHQYSRDVQLLLIGFISVYAFIWHIKSLKFESVRVTLVGQLKSWIPLMYLRE